MNKDFNTDNDLILVVSNDDLPLGYENKITVHEKCILHRAFSLFVFNADFSKMLLQKRVLHKYHSGGLWSNACCGHFNNHNIEMNDIDTVKQRTFEELEIRFNDVKKFGVMHYCEKVSDILFENEIDHLYYAICDEDVVINFNKDEVDDTKWIDVEDLFNNQIKFDEYSVWFKKVIDDCLLNVLLGKKAAVSDK